MHLILSISLLAFSLTLTSKVSGTKLIFVNDFVKEPTTAAPPPSRPLENVIGAYCEQYKVFPTGIRMKSVKSITDILVHATRRRLLKVYIANHGRIDDQVQVEVWELCDQFMQFCDKTFRDAAGPFKYIWTNVTAENGYRQSKLELPQKVIDIFRSRSEPYVTKIRTLQTALTENLQKHIFEKFMNKLGKDLPEYEKGLRRCIQLIKDDFLI